MNPLVIQTDFGLSDGAVSAMYGVAESVSHKLRVFDLTHDIPQYNIWEASYRLIQTIGYWPPKTVFVSVVDPGVGSSRRSIGVETKSGHYVITPDNGTLTHTNRMIGIASAREIDESINRLPGSGESYTFHGRDIYAYTGARLAAGVIDFSQIGPEFDTASVVELPVVDAVCGDNNVRGTVDVLDVRFGSLWTNIPRGMFGKLGIKYGERVGVQISVDGRVRFENRLVFAKSFAEVSLGESLVYVNSLDCMAVAINQGSFANAYGIGTGNNWHITFFE